ncbi:hypothetical protein V5799_020829 [Amblyomma americanum]|uniref:Uncharacterized protein n=1 Tax=Amblyomma americanum TaxID=6943 RepID=A0AAQ4ESZ4_AMBAM
MHVHIYNFSDKREQCLLAVDSFLIALAGFAFARDVFTGSRLDLDMVVVLPSFFSYDSCSSTSGETKIWTGEFHAEIARDSRGTTTNAEHNGKYQFP